MLGTGCARHAHYRRRGLIPATLYMCRARAHFVRGAWHTGREERGAFIKPLLATSCEWHSQTYTAAPQQTRKGNSFHISSPFLLIKRALHFPPRWWMEKRKFELKGLWWIPPCGLFATGVLKAFGNLRHCSQHSIL